MQNFFHTVYAKKAEEVGIKIWAICEAGSGYVLGFQIYTGKTNGQSENGLSFRVVCELAETYLNNGYRLFFDKFYTSVDLLQYLVTKKTYACGTVKANRKLLPPEILDDKMEKGEAQFWKWDNLTAVRWRDKRDVLLLSTIDCNEMVEIPKRRDEQESICKPKLICDYNVYMNGVDKCDQYLSYYSLSRKSRKWWKKSSLDWLKFRL